MQETHTTSLTHISNSQWSLPGNDLIEELNAHIPLIETMLSSYHYESRGYVSDCRIDANSILYDAPYKGTFVIQYNLNYTVSCSDVNYDTSDKMVFQFIINVGRCSITFLGEDIREREPDEL